MQIEELHVVILQNLLERTRRVTGGRRVIATELVASVKRQSEKTTFAQIRLRQRRRGFVPELGIHRLVEEGSVNRRWSDIVEENGRAYRSQARLFGIGQQRGEVLPGQRRYGSWPLRLGQTG